jgi:hypothetical protein
MPAIVKVLQVDSPYKIKLIIDAIHAETETLPTPCEISIFSGGERDQWELVIKTAHGTEVRRTLNAEHGDLTPVVFRVTLQEMVKLI